jgi:hypothetical protein
MGMMYVRLRGRQRIRRLSSSFFHGSATYSGFRYGPRIKRYLRVAVTSKAASLQPRRKCVEADQYLVAVKWPVTLRALILLGGLPRQRSEISTASCGRLVAPTAGCGCRVVRVAPFLPMPIRGELSFPQGFPC